jgi:hypothetical protein
MNGACKSVVGKVWSTEEPGNDEVYQDVNFFVNASYRCDIPNPIEMRHI